MSRTTFDLNPATMKFLYSFCLLIATVYLPAQQQAPEFYAQTFEAQVLSYQPAQRAGVSPKAYAFGTMVLRETISQSGNDPAAFNRADYFNVLTAFLSLGESTEAIDLAFTKFRNSEGSCEYFTDNSFPIETNDRYLPIRERWHDAAMDCRTDAGEQPVPIDPKAYAKAQDLNTGLVMLMAEVSARDQCFRSPYVPEQQVPLDRQNERVIDSLFQDYGVYIGKTHVGEEYAHVMWSVIQHSRLPVMERYLSVVHQAVIEKELAPAPLKMLIDRVYAQKHGGQVFGSQAGVVLLPESERKQIIIRFGL